MSYSEFEDAPPNPEFLIKSIAEQGYSLETALADLIDNAIAADAKQIEILIDSTSSPLTLFLADDGKGMTESTLRKSMQFPSSSPDEERRPGDLGRFGLGLKTASFSQTRHLSVLSRTPDSEQFLGRSWDIGMLKSGQWKIRIETPQEINTLFLRYKALSAGFQHAFSEYRASTIVVWRGLYKFEDYISEPGRSIELKRQITEVTSQYLSLVFHRFLEVGDSPVAIRINNVRINPFNPFPVAQADFRKLESNRKKFQTDNLLIEGYVLPARSLDESKEDGSVWTQRGRSLTDMEGLYIYRGNRIILHGGWNGIVRKRPRWQLARMKVNIGNRADGHFHLNVAKSSIAIPPDLRIAFVRYISELGHEAQREYFNRGLKKISVTRDKVKASLFIRVPSEKGMLLKVNQAFPILNNLMSELSPVQASQLAVIFRMVNTMVNRVRQIHEDEPLNRISEKDDIDSSAILVAIRLLQENGVSGEDIRENFLIGMGIRNDSIPDNIMQLLKKIP
jgi:hypothetical protein